MEKKALMNLSKNVFKGKNKMVLGALIIILFAMYMIIGPLHLASIISYTTAYQGAQSSFAGVAWANQDYSTNGASVPYGGHLSLTGTTMSFNAGRDPVTGKKYPTITGEMTSVFIPESAALSQVPSWVPTSWLQGWATISNPDNNPSKTYTWTSGSSSYVMQQWQTEWYVTLASDTSGEIRYGDNTFNAAYNGPLQIWLRLNTNNGGWYFNQTNLQYTYFAIAKLLVTNSEWDGHNKANVQTSPQVAGTSMTCFLNDFGAAGNASAPSTSQILSYQGVALNPVYFNGGVYAVINLDNFGTQMWWDWGSLGNKYQGDTLSLEISVTQFVVGNWLVQDIQQNPGSSYIKPSPINGGGGASFIGAIGNLLNNPLFDLAALGVTIIILFGIMVLVFPESIVLIKQALTSAGKKRNARRG